MHRIFALDISTSHSFSLVSMRSSSGSEAYMVDVEMEAVNSHHKTLNDVQNFAWEGVSVQVQDRQTKQQKTILHNSEGIIKAGEICALMGPSGCGKTTLLNVLAHRSTTSSGAHVEGTMLVNGSKTSLETFRHLSSYVEQEDALIGSLTVRETMNFAARLAHPT
jgi:ABC-type multidrug transport system ATPase subunit